MSLEDYMLPCLTKKFFGFDCLGCGIQRSLALIFKGEFIAAFSMYPAIYTLILLFIFILVSYKVKIKHSNKIISRLAYVNLIIIIVNYIIKLNH